MFLFLVLGLVLLTACADGARPVERVNAALDPLPQDLAAEQTVAGGGPGGERTPAAGLEAEDAAVDMRPRSDPPESSSGSLPSPVEVPPGPPRFVRPEHVHGIYLNAWTAGSSRRLEALLRLARETEVNTFVIDLKDASGYVSYATGVPLARAAGAVGELRIHDLSGLLRRLEEEGVYPVARIVVVKDPVLVGARPDLAVQDVDGGPWVDGKGIRWLDLHRREVWDYHVDLASEAVKLGFPEIQWDYVRFPDAPRSELERAVYAGSGERTKPEVVRAFLDYSRQRLGELGAVVAADVFGVTTSARDVGIGQVWEAFIDVVDVAQPMVYPSHYYRGSFGIESPNAYPYEIVREAVEHGLKRSATVEGAGTLRPWLQDFTLGEPPYGPAEVRAQIQAVYDAGAEEWVLWNPSSHYTEEALLGAGGEGSVPEIRVAGRLLPVSERFEALASAALQEPDSASAASGPGEAVETPPPDGSGPDTPGGG